MKQVALRRRRLTSALIAVAALLAGALVAPPFAAAAPAGSPIGTFDHLSTTSSGILVQGWAIDPGTRGPINVSINAEGKTIGTALASSSRPDVAVAHPAYGANHGFAARFVLGSGAHRVCIAAVNIGAGANRFLSCKSVLVRANPLGHLDSARQTIGGVLVTGWAFDPDSPAALAVQITDGPKIASTTRAGLLRPDVANSYRTAGAHRGFTVTAPIRTAGSHVVCAAAINVGSGTAVRVSLGCVTLYFRVDPTGLLHAIPRPARSTSIVVDGWAVDPETDAALDVHINIDGQVPISVRANVSMPALRVPYLGIGTKHGFKATFAVDDQAHRVCAVAYNLLSGKNLNLGCKTSPTLVRPIGPVTSPALISTSRYIRNINGSRTDTVKTRAMGITDASHNPSNHRYLTLLQIGGQTTTGIILSATSVYVTYAQTVTALKAYIDGYASTQKTNAPAIIAVGTNNDIDVRALTGAIWATKVINPLRAYAAKYRNITIAGANDIEPGFIGSMAASASWVSGYLAATPAKFVFNGSADGCGSSAPASKCNNGWTAAGMAWISGGAAPTRILSLPQIYNYTMPKQWKYISMTNVVAGKARVNFAGPLTEWTACYTQGGGCGSLSNNAAWTALWEQLGSDARVNQSSLPYGTDLRIN